MFQFNFSDDSSDEIEKPSKKLKIDEIQEENVLPFIEIVAQFKDEEDVKALCYQFKDQSIIKCVQSSVDITKSKSATNGIKENSDLIPCVYEGGLKVWECSLDLVEFFIEQNMDFKSKNVLEIGCGCGLPGLHALKKSAASVHFQDYNEEVLRHVTIPNVFMNSNDGDDDDCVNKARFFAGDWSYLLQEDLIQYDVILSSETIYCPKNYEKLHKIFEKFLHPLGTCLVAAKTFYFGVGGGTRDFEDFVRKMDVFDVSSTKTFTEGVQREILTLKFKNQETPETK